MNATFAPFEMAKRPYSGASRSTRLEGSEPTPPNFSITSTCLPGAYVKSTLVFRPLVQLKIWHWVWIEMGLRFWPQSDRGTSPQLLKFHAKEELLVLY